MITHTFDHVTGPTCWASYLVNGDASGITPDDRALADAWRKANGIFAVLSIRDDSERFTWQYSLYGGGCRGGDVCDYLCDLARGA